MMEKAPPAITLGFSLCSKCSTSEQVALGLRVNPHGRRTGRNTYSIHGLSLDVPAAACCPAP